LVENFIAFCVGTGRNFLFIVSLSENTGASQRYKLHIAHNF